MFWTVAAIYLLALVERSSTSAAADPPHIIIILADDLGWNDVSFHGSNQFQTPNIDALAYSGVILQDYYTQPICTPARAALLTGRHPISNGMEHDVIYAPEPWGLPLKEKLLPQYLKSLGYVSRAVGKWHLGFYKAAYTPTRRGFDSHFGTWLGHGNHFTYMSYENSPGYDLHRDRNIAWKGQGKFSADLFTEEAEAVIRDHNVSKPLFLYLAHTAPHAPFQAPQETIASLRHVPGVKRRTYAAMVTKVDESVGKVVQELKNKDMLNNSIVLFLTDNGGEINGNNGNVASNWPLKGGKNTLWEGGVRGVGLIWSPLLKATPRVHRGLVSVQDWLPTLLEAAGATSNTFDMSQLDGVSQWTALNNQSKPPYTTMLHNIDPIWNVAAIRKGKWKLSTGRTRGGRYDGWFGRVRSSSDTYNVDHVRDSLAGRAVQSTTQPLPSEANILGLRNQATISCNPPTDKHARKGEMCRPQRSPCLFDIVTDPCEHRNVAKRHPKVVARLTALLEQFQPVKPCNKPLDPRSYPRHWNYTWTTWRDYV